MNYDVGLIFLKLCFKARYDGELQNYLTANGLQASDLVKPRGKKKDVKDKSPSVPVSASQVVVSNAPQPADTMILTPEQMAEEMARTILESAGMTGDVVTGLGDFGSEVSSNRCAADDGTKGFLPHFSQVWSGQEMMFNGTDHMATAPSGTCLPNIVAASHQPEAGLQSAAMCK